MVKGQNTPTLTNALKKRVEFLLVHEGLTQTQTAKIVGVDRTTVFKWNKKHKWSGKQKIKSDKVRFDDSLNAFLAWSSIHHPDSKDQLNELVKKFKKNI